MSLISRYPLTAQTVAVLQRYIPAPPQLLTHAGINAAQFYQSFDYWTSLTTIDKWFALPPGTPEPIVKAYQEAYEKIGKDEEFLARARKISEDIEPQSGADVKRLIDTLGSVPTPAIEQISVMLKKQGLSTE